MTIMATEEFKMTDLGTLPADWNVISLGEVLDDVDCRVRDTGLTDIPILSMTRHQGLILQSEKFEKRVASRDVRNYKVVQKGQIVCGFPMDEGVVYTLRRFDMGAVSPVYEVWRLMSGIMDIDFLDELLRTPFLISTYRRLTSKTVERRRIVSRRDFREIKVPLPPLPEQKKIAAVLSTVQEAKEKTEVVIEATKELKRSLMKHLFTYGPVSPKEAENVPLKETKIGLVPEGWEVHSLGEIAEVRYGIQASVSRNIDSSMGIPILTNVNITLDGQISLAQLKYYDLEKKKNGDEYILRRGDVVFNWRSGSKKHLGKTAYFDLNREMTHSSFILRIRSLNNEYVNNKYLYHYLLFIKSLAKYFEQYYDFVVNAKFNASHTRQIPVYVPPLEVQTEIADILSSVASRIEVEENKKKALEELFRTLLNNLMTGKIRVNQLEVEA